MPKAIFDKQLFNLVRIDLVVFGFSAIADLISQSSDKIALLFLEVLMICDEMELIGKNIFAIDGCKMSFNASKERGGTKEELLHKKLKMEKVVRKILKKHREADQSETDQQLVDDEKQYVLTLKKGINEIKTFLSENDEKIGKTGKAIKSNVTDDDSAKITTGHGVIQGYDGVAAVDDKHLIIVHAEAFGQAQEHDLLEPMIQGVRDDMFTIGHKKDAFKKAKLPADAGFHTEENMKMVVEQKIDGYVADINFRKRDPRFKDVDKNKERSRKEKAKQSDSQKQFTTDDFKFAEDLCYCIYPAGKRLYRNGGNSYSKGLHAVRFMGPKCACVPCHLRKKSLRARAKITSHFEAPMHPAWLRCESLKYLDNPALSRLARQAPQHLKM